MLVFVRIEKQVGELFQVNVYEKGDSLGIIYLDFSKVFYKVSHKRIGLDRFKYLYDVYFYF